MRVPQGAHQRLATPTGYFVPDGLGDEAAAVALHPVDVLDQFDRQGDGDALGSGHGSSGKQVSKIILRLHRNVVPRRVPVPEAVDGMLVVPTAWWNHDDEFVGLPERGLVL
jgi:hypothetical protein